MATRTTGKSGRKRSGATRASGKSATGAKTPGGSRRTGTGAAAGEGRLWALRAGLAIFAVTGLRLAINATGIVPVHFDEAQYWAYGEELAWGYYSKPPLVGAVIRLATELGGDTLFWLRAASPVAHAAIAMALFALGARLFDPRTGFWASVAWLAAPGVTVSAMIMSTDPVMMALWAFAMVAWLRAAESGRATDWALTGALVGAGALAKYTALALPASAAGYGIFAAAARDWRGVGIAAAVGLAVMAPNLAWNAAHDFATVTHVAEDADPGRGYLNPGKFAEFVGAQLGVIGPVIFLALLAALWQAARRGEGRAVSLLAWTAAPLLVGMLGLAFLTRAQPNWAAPAYLGGTVLAVHWLLARGWKGALRLHLGLGVAAAALVWGLGWLYAERAEELPRWGDPFKKMRLSGPFCGLALAAMDEEGAEVLLSDDRRRLSECMFEGSLGWDRIAVWNPELVPENHHELVATLKEGDERAMLLAVERGAEAIADRFEEAREIDAGSFRTHADREHPYELWLVQGFRGYDVAYRALTALASGAACGGTRSGRARGVAAVRASRRWPPPAAAPGARRGDGYCVATGRRPR